jgi:hypothetical protein
LTPLQQTARAYLDRQWVVLVLPYRTKHRLPEGWPELRLTAEQCDRILGTGRHNLGVHLGPPSAFLADLDLDTEQARRLAQTPGWLPRTPAVFGRSGSPRSHFLYTAPDGPAEATDGLKHQSLEGADVVTHAELRWGPGWQTIFPGSAHDATGEDIVWMPDPADDGSDAHAARRPAPWDVPVPTIAGWAELLRAAGRIAAGSLLARCWPDFRSQRLRNRVTLALAGAILRDPAWTAERLWDFLRPVLEVSGAEDEYPVRWGTIRKTGKNLAAGRRCVGWNELLTQHHLTSADVDLLKRWLQLAPAPDEDVVQIAAQNAAHTNGRATPTAAAGAIAGGASQYSGAAAAAVGGGQAGTGQRVEIELVPDDVAGNTAATIAGVEAANTAASPPRLFDHGGGLARLVRTVPEPGRGTGASPPHGALTIQPLATGALLTNELLHLCDFVENRGRRSQPTTPPPALQTNLAATPASHWRIPRLTRLADTPVYTADGRLLLDDGFDAASGVYVELAPELRGLSVPAAPSRADVDGAVAELLAGVWKYFPFRGAADKANALAGALTPLLRAIIDGATPLHAITASTPGTGKTWLAHSMARPFAGDRIGEYAPIPGAESETELVKKLTGYFKEGLPAILVDNGDGFASSPTLANATTRRRWRERLLGGNAISDYPIDVLWLFTGNNPQFDTAMARRIVPIELQPMAEDATVRPDIPPDHQGEGWLVAQRRRQVEALLVLVAWWRTQPAAPYRGPVLGGYESWARTLGAVFQCCGVPDFLANIADARTRSSASDENCRHFFGVWWRTFADTEVTADEAWTKVGVLTDIVDELPVRNEPPVRALGRFLLRQCGRIYAGKRLVSGGQTHGRRRWTLADP